MKYLTPFGLPDLTPTETKQYDHILQIIKKNILKKGYKKIKTPSIEYLDTLAIALSPTLKKQLIQFLDHSGNILALRPDLTIPVARLVASQMKDSPLPLKLYYQDTIFRNHPPNSQQHVEQVQAGVELIGNNTPEADAEIIKLCITIIQELGFKNFIIDIGHPACVKTLSDKTKNALLNGDYASLKTLPERGGKTIIEDIPELTSLYQALKKQKCEHLITFNKGLVKEIHHYTGMIFECYIEGIRQVVATGGRYNNLIKKFGYDCPAVGFALNVNALAKHYWRQQP